ncbi:TetR family transcriptional regulator [Frankia sp. CNm7]|uniref:TetR family transcriptional regulator n=1 Tax=Frankia nepalensis TaxID=1836974 RepID=A0A937RKG2_9ACTN|nr:TetR family transcriptional regulator [Frankia nepalensis]MBL7501642.1 TetR family transcriptional regulator [Frankia nepalensis]MBL7513374.1 TetR family transcriptional regulator [Frankia nepalensis]MBL7523017.1 TetR family transcriptional regulator [Frankia nepalensis]MBL7628073.1 TetR family transcriptional regulator [Frankia nepalensis]
MLEERTKPHAREAQRLETRQRVFDAAIAEYKRSGMAEADIGAIATAAGVARGTFYFHFPTKEHVLAELDHSEQERMAKQLSRFLASPRDLPAVFDEVVRLVTAIERRLGKVLFRDVLAYHFSPARPTSADWTEYPVILLVIRAIEQARDRGEIYPEADVRHSAFFFLVGLYGLLIAVTGSQSDRTTILRNFVATVLRGLESR